jgi:type IV secretory pathway TrbD component
MSCTITLGVRLREIREELYGDGADVLAAALGLPERTWLNYECGVVMPAIVLLQFIVLTGADPHWLLGGEGRRLTERSDYPGR